MGALASNSNRSDIIQLNCISVTRLGSDQIHSSLAAFKGGEVYSDVLFISFRLLTYRFTSPNCHKHYPSMTALIIRPSDFQLRSRYNSQWRGRCCHVSRPLLPCLGKLRIEAGVYSITPSFILQSPTISKIIFAIITSKVKSSHFSNRISYSS